MVVLFVDRGWFPLWLLACLCDASRSIMAPGDYPSIVASVALLLVNLHHFLNDVSEKTLQVRRRRSHLQIRFQHCRGSGLLLKT